MAEKNKKGLGILLLAGAGVLAYLLWPIPEKKGFIIREISWQPPMPEIGQEVVVTVLGKNTTEQADCYCKIINSDTQQEVFYDHAIVNKDELHPFIHTTTMPSELKLRIETGKIIEGKQEISDFKDIVIQPPPKMDLTLLDVNVE